MARWWGSKKKEKKVNEMIPNASLLCSYPSPSPSERLLLVSDGSRYRDPNPNIRQSSGTLHRGQVSIIRTRGVKDTRRTQYTEPTKQAGLTEVKAKATEPAWGYSRSSACMLVV